MELSAAEQERYSRHLLLDGFDQEKLKAACVAVRGRGAAAHWAARYLAASGVGRIFVEEPAWREELLGLGPWLELSTAAASEAALVCGHGQAALVCARDGDDPAEGALAALQTVRQVLST
jgi:hypothetical protein